MPPAADTSPARAFRRGASLTSRRAGGRRISGWDVRARGGFRAAVGVPLMREGMAASARSSSVASEPGRSPTSRSSCCRRSPIRQSSRSRTCGCSRSSRRGRRTHAIGGRAQSAGRGRAGGQLDARSRDRALDDRLPRHPARRHGRRIDLGVRRSARGVLSACDRPAARRAGRALRAAPIRKGEGALGRLAMTGEPVEIRDIADEPATRAASGRSSSGCGYRSVLAVPLLREDHLLGGARREPEDRRRIRRRR